MRNKVLNILHFPPPIHGASMVGKYIKESELINSRIKSKYVNLSTSRSIDEVGKRNWTKVYRFSSIFVKVVKAMAFFRPKLTYITATSQGAAFFRDYVLVKISRIFGSKVIIHFHNKGVSTKHDKTIYNFFYRSFFKGNRVILLSKQLYYDVEKYVSIKDIYFLGNGVPLEDYENSTKKSKKFQILFLSNLIESKGVYVLLEALKILNEQNYSFSCKFVGGEHDISKAEFENKVLKLELNEKVEYLGKRYGQEKLRILNNSDVFVFPTYYHNECYPLVLLEAMQMGLPIITTAEGAISDIVENEKSGFIVQKNNSLEIANKLITLLEDNELVLRMGNSARAKFLKEHTLNVFEENFLKIIESELSE